ncbi:hypothetical protein BURKHO8Y_10191 [Burkholderia sp. 8Y]|nr:hypothetical protein BURKHO8Y_10191 [Burkholderia sp. 8Y]
MPQRNMLKCHENLVVTGVAVGESSVLWPHPVK